MQAEGSFERFLDEACLGSHRQAAALETIGERKQQDKMGFSL
jgi:hypothetical protein